MKGKLIILVLSVLVLANGCKEKIEFELNDEDHKRVVVEGFITNETKSHLIKLSYTSSYYGGESPQAVSGATLSISNGSDLWSLTETPVGSGCYYTDPTVSGTVGDAHTLTIVVDGETYKGTDVMYPVAPLDSIAIDNFGDEENPNYHLLIWSQETPGVGDYYRWMIYHNGVTDNDTLDNYLWNDDSLYDGVLLEGYDFQGFGNEIEVGDTMALSQMSLSQQANDIFIAMNLETNWRGGLFDSAPSNVQTNMSNGAIGFFGASAVSTQTTIVGE